ncbi:hypothetical protein [Streptomyces roseolus]|uniref:hypothetical protein n=1 Tax=Streptomyces roseolus TaxID=67358 RepID=UPI001678D4AA|nr:hypothetical protein [Streptomyces roseolus]GGR13603.1 hypothetical protein GCM10010282_02490 [Streptomyces roseolus]
MTAQADGRPVPDGIKTLVQSELNALSARLFDVLSSSVKSVGDLEKWLGNQLCAVDQLRFQLESVQGILATCALAEGIDRSRVANWLDASQDELDWFTTGPWTEAQVAAARGDKCPGANYETREAYRVTRADLNRSEYYAERTTLIANMLAVAHVGRSDLEEQHGWLADRTRKAIKYGWTLQPKRAPVVKPAQEADQVEASSPTDATAAA